MTRNCVKCGSEISGCMGFGKAGDTLEVTPTAVVRELCGRCALSFEWTPKGTLVPQDIQAINAELGALR